MNVLFVVNTEFHLFVSLYLYYNNYINNNVKFIVIKSKFRFQDSYQFNKLNVEFIDNTDFNNLKKYNKNIISQINNISTNSYDKVYVFQDADFINNLLISTLKSKKSKLEITLVQDGLVAYVSDYDKVKTLKKRIKLNLLKYFYGYKKLNTTLFWGSNYLIDNYLVSSPEHTIIKTNKKIEKLEFNATSLFSNQLIFDFFKFDSSKYSLSSEKRYVFFISQGYISEKSRKIEIKILNLLIEKCNLHNYELIVKLHPSESIETFSQFTLSNNTTIISEKFPAEFIMINIKNSIIMSGYSSSLLINIQTNKFFWIYPMIYDINFNFKLDHIKVLNTINDLNTIFE